MNLEGKEKKLAFTPSLSIINESSLVTTQQL
jgi:hypothetical protein